MRQKNHVHNSGGFLISIHAPIKDATKYYFILWDKIRDFNSRTHKGCDLWDKEMIEQGLSFQFTHP